MIDMSLRNSGINIIGQVPWGTHFCQFYRTQQDLLDILVPFFKAGLENNEFCVWITSEPLTADKVRKVMTETIPGFPEYQQSGQIEILAYDDWYAFESSFESNRSLRGLIEKLNSAFNKGFTGLRLTGNTFRLNTLTPGNITEYEAKVQEVIRKRNILALCTCCLDKCHAPDIIEVIRSHRFALVKRDGKWEYIENAFNMLMNDRPQINHHGISDTEAADHAAKTIESEERLKKLQEIAQLGTWELDLIKDRLTWSDEVYRIFGMRPQEFGAKYETFLEAVHPDDRSTVDSAYTGSLAEGKDSYEIEHRIIRKSDGEVRHVHEKCFHFRDNTKIIIRSLGVIHDITKYKKAEIELLNNIRHSRLLTDIDLLLLQSESPEDIVDTICRKTMEYLNCDMFINYLVDEKNNRLQLSACGGIPPERTADMQYIQYGNDICGCVARDRMPAVAGDIQHSDDTGLNRIKSMGVQAYYCRPLLIDENLLGTLSFGSRSRTRFTEDEINLMDNIVNHVTIAMEHNTVRETLRQTMEYLDSLFNYANAPIIVWDTQLRITRFNQAFERLTGRSYVEVKGKKIDILFPEEGKRDFLELIHRTTATGERLETIEIPILHVDGSVKTVLWNSANVYDADGKTAIATIAQGQDITERKHVEQQIRQHLGTLDLAQIIVRDIKGKIVFWNEGAHRLYGYTQEEAIGKISHKLLNTIFPDSQDNIIKEVLEKDKWEGELTQTKKDGSQIISASYWVLQRDSDNKPSLIVESNTDITRAKKAENTLIHRTFELENTKRQNELILKSVGEGICGVDLKGNITFINPSGARLVGWTTEELIGKNAHSIFHYIRSDGCPYPEEDCPVRNALTTGNTIDVNDEEFVRKDGTRFPVEFLATPVEEDGTIVGVVIAFRDVTERKRSENEIRQLNESLKHRATELEASNKELEAFSYSVSHDLRAPLRSLEGFSQAVLEDYTDKLDNEGKQYLMWIQESSTLMAQLIDDLLKLSRVTRSEMNFSEVNLSKISNEIAGSLKNKEPSRNVEIIITPDLIVTGDVNLLKVMMENLIGNAWKFTGKVTSAKIEIGAIKTDNKTTYYVKDNGAGFDEKYAGKLFQPFQRLHKTEDFPGTGIGLATVQRIIRRHRGNVWAKSKEGNVTTFYFNINS